MAACKSTEDPAKLGMCGKCFARNQLIFLIQNAKQPPPFILQQQQLNSREAVLAPAPTALIGPMAHHPGPGCLPPAVKINEFITE